MGAKIKLGKTATSRTRAKAKAEEPTTQQFNDRHPAFTDYLLSKGFSRRTAYRYVSDFTRFETWTKQENIPLESVSYNDMLHYIQHKRKTVEQNTIGYISNAIKHFFNYLLANGTIKENPIATVIVKGVRRKKLYDILSKQELENLYHAYPTEIDKKNENKSWYKASAFNARRNKIILGLLIYQGLTAIELFRLTVKDVKLREGKIYIAGTRKSNERELKLESVQILDMMEYVLKSRPEMLLHLSKNSEALLISPGQSQQLNNSLHKFTKSLKKLNPKVSSLKHIRTSVITHWLKHNHLRQVQYMAGHRYVSSTEAFLVNDIDDLLEDITKFHPIG